MTGAIQAGGRSSRMGRDKAWLRCDGRALIEWVLAAARPVVDRLFIVLDPMTPHREQYLALCRRWSAEAIDDLHPGHGPLAGIETVLSHGVDGASALVLACDLPFLTAPLLARLRAEAIEHPGQIIVPLDGDGRVQPLAAVYPATCLSAVREQLAAGSRRVDLLYDRYRTRRLPFAEISSLAGAERFFINVNTPTDYQAAQTTPPPRSG